MDRRFTWFLPRALSIGRRAADERGYTLTEMIVVMAVLGVVVTAIASLFATGVGASGDQIRRFESQQQVQTAMNRLQRDGHSGCTISTPSTYNTWTSSVTMYFPSDSCASGSHSVTWCTRATGTTYSLYRIVGTSCASATAVYASNLVGANIFVYLPPSSHLVTTTSLGAGTSSSYIATQDNSNVLARLHVDMTATLKSGKHDQYRLFDDIALRNGPRACSGTASC